MRLRYPGIQNALLDQEDDQHVVIPGAWRDEVNMADVEDVRGGNRATIAAKKQRQYLKLFYNSALGALPWQQRML